MQRFILIVALLALVGGGIYVGYFRNRPVTDPLEGERVLVEEGPIMATVSATGNVEANEQLALTFQSPGRIAEVLVEEGQRVRKGQLLARLDRSELEFALAQAESNVAIQQARLRQLQDPADPGEIRAAEASLASARANLQRVRQGANPEEIRAARAQLAAAEAGLASVQAGPDENKLIAAKAEMDRAEAALKQAQAAYDQVSYRPDIAMLPQSLQLEQATINYEAAKANYNAASAGAGSDQIEQARASVVQAQARLNQLLQGPNAADISAAEAQIAQAEATLARLQVGVNENDLIIAQANLAQAETSLAQAKKNLEGMELYAPFAGTIAEVRFREGELVTSAQPMVTLVDLSAFRIEVEVDEVDIGQVHVGNAVSIVVDSLPDEVISGTVSYIAPLPGVAEGVVTYPVRILLDAERVPDLRVGMSANVDIVTETHEEALLVPNRAIEIDRSTGQLFVERIEGDQAVRVELQIGLRNEMYSEVLSGVQAGDTLLIRTIDSRERLQQGLSN